MKRRFSAFGARILLGICSGILPLTAVAQSPQLATAIDPSVHPAAAGGGASYNPIATPDGRYVVFASTAENLALTSSNTPFLKQSPPKLNVFLRDRVGGTTRLVSVNLAGTSGGNGDSLPTALSTNGQFVLFESTASDLVAGDTNNAGDVFIRDVIAGVTTLVSTTPNGRPDNGRSWQSTMTPDGRYVAFSSAANDLVPDDTNGIPDVFVRDLQAGTTTLASPGATGAGSPPLGSSDAPQITPDGRYIAFLCSATNLVPGVTTPNEVYVFDSLAQTTYAVSTNAHALLSGTISSFGHAISDDGQFVAFQSSSSTTGILQRYNLFTGAADLISTNPVVPTIGLRHLRTLDMTPDGGRIAFVGQTTNGQQAFLWDAQTATTILLNVSLINPPTTNATFETPVLDSTGRFAAFLSTATDLVTNTLAPGFHLFLRDVQSGNTSLIDADSTGAASSKDFLNAPRLTPGGGLVIFDATDSGLVSDDSNGAYDVFIRDVAAGSTELVSVRDSSLPCPAGNAPIAGAIGSLSPDGRFVAFASAANNLVPNGTNSYWSIFVRDQVNGTNVLASVDTNGLAGVDGPCREPSISADGRYVAFSSSADNLSPGDANNAKDVFVRDLLAGQTTLVSINTNGLAGNNRSYSPVISADGRYVLFRSVATDLAPRTFAGEKIFLRDLQTGTTYALTTAGVYSSFPTMTPDGRYILFDDASVPPTRLYVWASAAASRIYTNILPSVPNPLIGATISSSGNLAAYSYWTNGGIDYLAASDLIHRTNWIIASSATSNSWSALRLSSDGHYLACVARTTPVGTNQVYLYDLQGGTNLLVSQAFGGGLPNGPSDSPDISPDGRFVVYRSAAGNIVPGDLNGFPDVFLFDRQSGATTLLSLSGSGSAAANNRSLAPMFSGDGQTIIFQSWASDLVSQDYNQTSDLFTVRLAISNSISAFVAQIIFVPGATQSPTITWAAQPGVSYRVEFRDDVSGSAWQPALATISVAGDRAYATDLAPNPSRRFYRIVAF